MTNIFNFMDTIAKRDTKKEADISDADKIREEYRKAELKLSEDSGKKGPYNPVELLTELITGQLAYSVADSFMEMTEHLDVDEVKEIVQRMDENGSEVATAMLQAMFLITGDQKTVKAMDILNLCSAFDHTAFDMFIDELSETEPFGMILMELWIEDGCDLNRPVAENRIS